MKPFVLGCRFFGRKMRTFFRGGGERKCNSVNVKLIGVNLALHQSYPCK